ncbi:GGDEF domain-containing protein [Zoogloea sp.]|uniref:GGDEF domain-containing protein n=1 Tax=Zoogloea sp. TaxID=49181 RepID=UPI00261D522A|nr:GGDEF domain-containing protein [uncultured Zoogloea sp.]
MIHVLKHVESITQHRDRSLLELGVASALFELVKAKEVNLYKVQAEETGHFLERVTHVGQDGLRFNSEFEPGNDLIPVSDRPEMRACVEEAQIVRRHDEAAGVFVHCFPIRVERGVLGVLEVICASPLVDEDLGTAEGFLGLYRNYLNLLDYSERDTLTGLRNRKTFDENIGKILGNISRPGGDESDQHRRRPDDGHQHWLAVVDVDHFKRVNDQFGHLYGDEVLLLLARIMRQSFRQQDKLFRFGGEEFVVVLRAATGAEVHRALERFRQAVEGYAFPQIGQVTASIGYTMIKPDDTIPEIVGRADDALYVAKESGRNQLANYEKLLAEGRIAVREQPSSDIEFF